MKTSALSTLLPLFIAVGNVAAHGFVDTMTVDGKAFKGNQLSFDQKVKFDSAIRLIKDASPVKLGQDRAAMNCGPNAKLASLVADAKPGSTLTFDWHSGDPGKPNWPHNTGPMLTYLASCGEASCDKFDASKAKWFKIDEVGKKQNGKWFQEDLFNGQAAKVSLPQNLKAGNYLVRHEIIGLHLAQKEGGAEFYPSCAQLRVSGDGTGAPTANELVSFPDAYTARDPGILVDAFTPGKKYVFPGPPVAKFVNSDSDSNGGDAGSPPSPAGTAVGSTASSPPAKKGSSNKKPCGSNSKRSIPRRPRHVSRVMRGIDSASFH